jgi:hypothetical protein
MLRKFYKFIEFFGFPFCTLGRCEDSSVVIYYNATTDCRSYKYQDSSSGTM